jgi:hypothetical protein
MNAIAETRQVNRGLTMDAGPGRMALADIISHVSLVQEVMRAVMKEDVHYGTIPGTPKPTLYKAGAEVLCMAFRIADTYEVEDLSTEHSVRYRVTCIGAHQINGVTLGTGMGEASSGEEKYKWRKAYGKEFEAAPPHLRRERFGYDQKKRESYSICQVRTEPADLANTILKMANKRAKIAMVLNVTAASDMFSQDLEDMDDALRDHLTRRGDAQGAPAPQASDVPEGKTTGTSQKAAAEGTGKSPPPCSAERFEERKEGWMRLVKAGKPVNAMIAMIQSKETLTEDQKVEIASWAPDAGSNNANS